jgi:hypothetical protein
MALFGAEKGAKFNEDKTHRIFLWRIWDTELPFVLFIGLNPSTADATKDDATIRRCKRFASDNGFGGMYMMNLFSIVSSDPKILLHGNTLVDGYDDELKNVASKCKAVVFCWGGFPEAVAREAEVIPMFPDALCFGHNADGTPKHPLYLKGDTKLIPFKI